MSSAIQPDVVVIAAHETIVVKDVYPPLSLTGDRVLTADDRGARIDNRGATRAVNAQLPPSSTIDPGWFVILTVKELFALKATAQGSDVIVHEGVATASSPAFAQSSAKSARLRVEYMGDQEFFAFEESGVWDFAP